MRHTIAGTIAHRFHFTVAFRFLGVVASAAFAILFGFMPETPAMKFIEKTP